MIEVKGFCPMGCGNTLVLNAAGQVMCRFLHCGEPLAVAQILARADQEHIVEYSERRSPSFYVVHPLRERLELHRRACTLDDHLDGLDGPPAGQGKRFRVVWDDEQELWRWLRLDLQTSEATT